MQNDAIKKYGGIYFVTSREFGPGHVECAEAALRGGVRIVQYREKSADTKTMLDEAERIKKLCMEYDALFIVDDRIDIALAVDADGIHIGDDDMPLQLAKKMLPGKIIGVSAKTPAQAEDAERDGAAYLGVGAVFPTQTKVKTMVIGIDGLKSVRNATKLPVYAIGGLKLDHVRQIKESGADGMAVITAIADQKDMEAAAAQLVRAWSGKPIS